MDITPWRPSRKIIEVFWDFLRKISQKNIEEISKVFNEKLLIFFYY